MHIAVAVMEGRAVPRSKEVAGSLRFRIYRAPRNKCHASSNRCLTSSNKKLLGTSASLLVTRIA